MKKYERRNWLKKDIGQKGEIVLSWGLFTIMLILTTMIVYTTITYTSHIEAAGLTCPKCEIGTFIGSSCTKKCDRCGFTNTIHTGWKTVTDKCPNGCGQIVTFEKCACGNNHRNNPHTGGCPIVHTHTYNSSYPQYNDVYHLAKCSCGSSVQETHSPYMKNGVCSRCGYTHIHNWTYTKCPNGCGMNGSKKCSTCGATETISHTCNHTHTLKLGTTYSKHDNSTHKGTCSCGQVFYQVHNTNGAVTYCTKTQGCNEVVSRACSACGYPTTYTHTCKVECKSHDIGYRSKGTIQHEAYCKVCGKILQTTNHTLSKIKTTNASLHQVKCSVCGYSTTEAHDWDTIACPKKCGSTIKVCADCGYQQSHICSPQTCIHPNKKYTSTGNTYHRESCSDCGKVLKEEIPHDIQKTYCQVPNCTERGTALLNERCTIIGCTYSKSYTHLCHIHNFAYIDQGNGTHMKICKLNCGKAGSQIEEDHRPGKRYCNICGENFDSKCVFCDYGKDHGCNKGNNGTGSDGGNVDSGNIGGIGQAGQLCTNGEHAFVQILCQQCKKGFLSIKCEKCGFEMQTEPHICEEHECVAPEEYQKDKDYHWKQCMVTSVDGVEQKCEKYVIPKEAHVDENQKDGKCDLCGYELGAGVANCEHKEKEIVGCEEKCKTCGIILNTAHTALKKSYNGAMHWDECTSCNYIGVESPHVDENKDRVCDICEFRYQDDFNIGDEYVVNEELSVTAVNLRTIPTISKMNNNMYQLEELIIYHIDYRNGGKDITNTVEIKLKLPIECEILESSGGDVKGNIITWIFAKGLESGEGGTKEVLLQYTSLSRNSLKYEIIEPIATMIVNKKEVDSSGVMNLIYRDSSTVITTKHAPYMKGYPEGDFRPDNSITRAEAAIVFSRIFGFAGEKPKATTSFNDIEGLYEEAVNAIKLMEKYKLVQGDGNGQYRPNDSITRTEFMVIVARKIQNDHSNESAFRIKDMDENVLLYSKYNNSWAINEITMLVRLNMAGPVENDIDLRINQNISRAEVAQLMNLYQFRAPTAMLYANEVQYTDTNESHKLFPDILEATRPEHSYKLTITSLER